MGYAGYNNGASPNFNASIYNTDALPGNRFSFLATSPWARVYHSVGALTQDGHVLTTGCNDPPFCAVSGLVLEALASPFRTYTLSLQSPVRAWLAGIALRPMPYTHNPLTRYPI